MAKARKTRRAKQRRARTQHPARSATRTAPAAVPVRQPEPANLAEEYQYVIADLKRIFTLAAGVLVVLIVLALVLR